LFGGAPIAGATKSTYDIAAVQAANSGGYVAVVSNASGSVTSSPPALLAVFTWTNPLAVTYGTPLSSDQLNAQATVPGTFDYTPTGGTLLGTGTHALSVIFTPTDTLDYGSLTGTVSLVVSPASLEITANDTNKSYGQTVSFSGKEFTAIGLTNSDAVTSVNLTSSGAAATAVVAGSPYSIVPGGATGSGIANYNIHYHNGSLIVSKATLVITPDNTNRLYGMPNPPFTGTLTGLQNADNITASFSCSATSASPAGQYAIVPTLEDPQGKLANYTVTVFIGTMTVISGPGSINTTLLSGQALLLSIPSVNGFQYVLESKQALGDPTWNPVQTNTGTGGIVIFSNSIGATPIAFYRIRIH
jgi:hypothetical protein